MASIPRYQPSARDPLFIMAMDHRASFAKSLFGITGEPTGAELHRMQDAKMVIFDGVRLVASEGTSLGRIGVLVDEKLGSEVARAVRSEGLVLAMPIERSGSALFELEYGEHFAEHVESFDPDFFKVLVRYNPADAERDRQTQIDRLVRVSDWADQAGRRWLFELLVPPTPEELAQWKDQDHFDRLARPTLTTEALTQLEAAGVHPTIWKLEGYETAEDAERVLKSVAGTDHPAECIVLGRDAPLSRVEHWLEVAAPLHGYAGFAVGRTIWEQPLTDFLGGRAERATAVATIAHHYRTLIETYIRASSAGAPNGSKKES
jgi:myo-inositol catabolism protein IolC